MKRDYNGHKIKKDTQFIQDSRKYFFSFCFFEWFENPVNEMIARNQNLANTDLINRLHTVLRPFLLRRQKNDVQKQLPHKFLLTIPCRLSRQQRRLYEVTFCLF